MAEVRWLSQCSPALLEGAEVLLRADWNVPLCPHTQTALDSARMKASLPTLQCLLDQGAAVRVITHLGRPQPVWSSAMLKQGYLPSATSSDSTQWLCRAAEAVLGQTVQHDDQWPAQHHRCQPGTITLCENVRWFEGETMNDPELARMMAQTADVVVMDAFATAHRAHASTMGLKTHHSAYHLGHLVEAEVKALSSFLDGSDSKRMAILGGAKVSTKLGLLQSLMPHFDVIAVGGCMAHTLLVAQGHRIGASKWEPEALPAAQALLRAAHQQNLTLLLPETVVVGDAQIKPLSEIDAEDCILDLAPHQVDAWLHQAATMDALLWNGPVGWYEQPPFDQGSLRLAEGIESLSAYTLVGGGDTLAVLSPSSHQNINHVCTGGGAMLAYLEQGGLPTLQSER